MKIDRRQFTSAMLAGLGSLAFSSCSGPSTGNANSKGTIAVLFDGLYSPFWVASHDAIIADLESRGFDAAEAISDQDDAKQLTQVRAMIARGVKGIIIVHTDSNSVIPAIRAANKARVPMVHFNRAPAPSDAFSVAVQADNRRIAGETVQHMVRVAKERGDKYKAAVLIGDLGDGNAIARRDGFFDAVDQNKDIIEVVSRIPTDWNADNAYSGLTNALQAHPDINFLFTSSDFLFPQIVEVMKKVGKFHKTDHAEHVIFGGFDGDETAYQLLEDKYLDADGVQELQVEAKLCVDAIVDMDAGQLVANSDEPNPTILHDPGFVIHQDNLMEMRDRMWGYQVHQKTAATTAKGGVNG